MTRRASSARSAEDASHYTFRRSRTLTGSLHSEVRAATEERSQLRSNRLHEHDLRAYRRRLGLILLGVLAAIGGLGYLVTSYSHDTVRVRVLGLPEVSQSTLEPYRTIGRAYLDQNPFERFRFLMNNTRFTQFIQREAPEVIEASIEAAEKPMQSEIVLRLRQPVAVWNSGPHQYFVGEDGITFQRSIAAAPRVTIIDKSANTELGNQAASGKMLRFIGRVVSLVNASGVGVVEAVELPASSTRQADLKLVGQPYNIKTYLDRDPAGQAADVVQAVKYFNAKGVTPRYIDVRVSSKAFYQ